VRELESTIDRVVITSQRSALQVLDRFETFGEAGEQGAQEIKALVDLERDHTFQVFRETNWRGTSQGLNPSTLRARMRSYGIRCH
jgi:hypothetical protein